MRTDPKAGMIAAFLVVALSAAWFSAQSFASEELFALFGFAMHAITFVCIFLFVAGLAVALLFRRFASVRQDLLDGRDVIARWNVDAATWSRFAAPAAGLERGEKQALLLTMYAFIALICGGLALTVTEDAAIFGGIGVGIAAIVTVAFLAGQKMYAKQLDYRGGEVVVGTRGVLVNGVLHVWDAWLSWLEGARLIARPYPMLSITYAYWARSGPQFVTVRVPFVPADATLAHDAEAALTAVAGGRSRSNAKGRGKGVATRDPVTRDER